MVSHVVFEDLEGDVITLPKSCLFLLSRCNDEGSDHTGYAQFTKIIFLK